MNTILSVLLTALAIAMTVRICMVFRNKIAFYTEGFDSGFKFSEIRVLWKLAVISHLSLPESLYISIPSLNSCIKKLIEDSKKKGTYESYRVQKLLEKLYKFRTRVAVNSKKKTGIQNSREISVNQKLRIVVKGSGVFTSRVLSNDREFVISLPKPENSPAEMNYVLKKAWWENKAVSVYFWRKNDASYVMDTDVYAAGFFRGEGCLYLRHTAFLERAQKRQSVRCPCEIKGMLYFITNASYNPRAAETGDGFKCLLEDISEDGAMIRIGGKCRRGSKIKLQFNVDGSFVIMAGIVKSVEYNRMLNQSRLHFECLNISPAMKNSILTYVYKISEEDSEKKAVMTLVNEDSSADEKETDQDELEKSENQEDLLEELEELDDADSDIETDSEREQEKVIAGSIEKEFLPS